jgi:hypothetical protein
MFENRGIPGRNFDVSERNCRARVQPSHVQTRQNVNISTTPLQDL